jgi:D-xylose transport system permease protein
MSTDVDIQPSQPRTSGPSRRHPQLLLAKLPESTREVLPVLAGLVLVIAVMTTLDPRFLSPGNVSNLLMQNAEPALIALGLVLVLLLGEIDLSVGAVSGFTSGIMAVLSVQHGVPAPAAIGSALVAGAAIGAAQGFWITNRRVPALIVTLGGLLGWQGALLAILGDQGTINITDSSIGFLAGSFLTPASAWAAALLLVVGFAALKISGRRAAVRFEVAAPSPAALAVQVGAVAVLILGSVLFLSLDRGVPLSVAMIGAITLVLHAVSRHTLFGRNVYAVGGNAEAARRAGIRVNGVRVAVFALAGLLAATGGVMGASRLLSVSPASGSGTLLLNAIAAVVIGGTSLFGGRGFIWSALLGTLIIGSISNGMDLLAFPSALKLGVTALVLVAAVTIDAAGRSRQPGGAR